MALVGTSLEHLGTGVPTTDFPFLNFDLVGSSGAMKTRMINFRLVVDLPF